MARMVIEAVYLGRDNSITLELLEDGLAVDLPAITRVVLDFPGLDIDSDIEPAAFDWTTTPKRLELKLAGVAGIAAHAGKNLTGRLVVYAPDHPNGLVWTESFRLRVEAGSLP